MGIDQLFIKGGELFFGLQPLLKKKRPFLKKKGIGEKSQKKGLQKHFGWFSLGGRGGLLTPKKKEKKGGRF